MRTAMHYAACLSALLSLTGCGARKPLVRTELVEVPVERYVSVPAALTDPLPEPAPPAALCTLGGVPAVCALDGLLWLGMWQKLLGRANEDRATTRALSGQPLPAGDLNTRDAELTR